MTTPLKGLDYVSVSVSVCDSVISAWCWRWASWERPEAKALPCQTVSGISPILKVFAVVEKRTGSNAWLMEQIGCRMMDGEAA